MPATAGGIGAGASSLVDSQAAAGRGTQSGQAALRPDRRLSRGLWLLIAPHGGATASRPGLRPRRAALGRAATSSQSRIRGAPTTDPWTGDDTGLVADDLLRCRQGATQLGEDAALPRPAAAAPCRCPGPALGEGRGAGGAAAADARPDGARAVPRCVERTGLTPVSAS